MYQYLYYLFQEPGEAINKDLKSFQLNHSPQISDIARNVATFERLMERSDPHLLRFYNKLARAKLERAREPFSTKVLSLCIGPEKKYVSSFWVMLIEWQGNFC